MSILKISAASRVLTLSVLLNFTQSSFTQTKSAERPSEHARQTSVPVATQWTLDAAGPVQQAEISAVLLLFCPVTQMKGSGFLIDKGLIVTNSHVVAGCAIDRMQGFTSRGEAVSFSKSVVDQDVDLALLKPSRVMTGGLHLAAANKLKVGSNMITWGYPLMFNGPAPILSTAVLAGFMEDGTGQKKVKHLILNGAINPGNSGGPIFQGDDDSVVGIVVAKFLPYRPEVQRYITMLASNPQTMFGGAGSGSFTGTDAQGRTVEIPQSSVVAMILQDFFNGTQVSLGEGISVEELKTLMASKAAQQL